MDDISDPNCPAVFMGPETAPTCSRARSTQIVHETGIIMFIAPPPNVRSPIAIVLFAVIVASPRQIPPANSPAAPNRAARQAQGMGARQTVAQISAADSRDASRFADSAEPASRHWTRACIVVERTYSRARKGCNYA
jgi:hypothetical protein